MSSHNSNTCVNACGLNQAWWIYAGREVQRDSLQSSDGWQNFTAGWAVTPPPPPPDLGQHAVSANISFLWSSGICNWPLGCCYFRWPASTDSFICIPLARLLLLYQGQICTDSDHVCERPDLMGCYYIAVQVGGLSGVAFSYILTQVLPYYS